MSNYVLPHRYIKIVNAYVSKMCFHIYTHGVQKSRHSGCVSTKTWEHACVSSWIPKWQGNSFVFPAPITIVLGKVYVLKTCFFWCCLKTEIRSCFSRSSSPEPLSLPETFHILRSKAKERTCSGKNGTSHNHMTIAKNTKFNAKKIQKIFVSKRNITSS